MRKGYNTGEQRRLGQAFSLVPLLFAHIIHVYGTSGRFRQRATSLALLRVAHGRLKDLKPHDGKVRFLRRRLILYISEGKVALSGCATSRENLYS